MNIGYDDSLNFDKVTNIIIDLGLRLTKIGFGNEPEPRKIIHSPSFFDYEKFMKDDTNIQLENNNKLNLINNENFNSVKQGNSDVKSILKFRLQCH